METYEQTAKRHDWDYVGETRSVTRRTNKPLYLYRTPDGKAFRTSYLYTEAWKALCIARGLVRRK